jgi:hypothetical protein
MAKIIAPFQISGTLDDLNFVVSDGINYVRTKGKTGITSKQFKENPIFDSIRNQGQEFGHCSKKAAIFRQLAVRFNQNAKDGSVAGRTNKMLFEILQEDSSQPKGKRTLAAGLKTEEGKEALLFFESNKLRPLRKVLKKEETYDSNNQTLTWTDFCAEEHLNWPEDATHVQLTSATANWDFENETFETCYSQDIILAKNTERQSITLTTNKPKGDNLHLTFLFIGFIKQDRKKQKLLHRKNNTATIIAYR